MFAGIGALAPIQIVQIILVVTDVLIVTPVNHPTPTRTGLLIPGHVTMTKTEFQISTILTMTTMGLSINMSAIDNNSNPYQLFFYITMAKKGDKFKYRIPPPLPTGVQVTTEEAVNLFSQSLLSQRYGHKFNWLSSSRVSSS
jgi:hypothetical protein